MSKGSPTSARAVRLAPMEPAQFEAFRARAAAEFALDKVRAGQWLAETAGDLARHALAALLTGGLDTPDHRLYVLREAVGDGRVGTAWLHLDRAAAPSVAYLYDIRIDDEAQGLGFGRAALLALEEQARAAGCSSLLLHTFGHNERACRLYESAGYRTTNVNMRKDFA